MTELQFMVATSTSELEVAVYEFSVYQRAEGLMPRTVRAYRWNLARLVGWLEERGVVSLRQVSRLMLREWNASLYEYWQPSTVKQAVTAARSFFRWAWEEKLIADDVSGVLRQPKVKLAQYRTISLAELEILLAHQNTATAIGKRNAAIMSLLFDSGLRAAELCSLTADNLNLSERELIVRIKGGDILPGWFGERTETLLRQWLPIRDVLAGAGTEELFVAIGGIQTGTGLKTGGLRKMLREAGNGAGLSGVCPHAFRRGFACTLSAAGISDNVLKDLGRWSTTEMIKRYTMAQRGRELYESPVDRTKERNR